MKIYILMFITIHCINASAQTSLVLQPNALEGKDATVWSVEPDLTQPDFKDVIAATWTWSGSPGSYRTYIEFNLTSIPVGTTIDEAYLSLYYNYVSTSNGQEGENAAYLRRVTEPWEEDEVTWNTKPDYSTIHQLLLPESDFEEQDYLDIDVTELVQDMLDDPDNSYGFIHMLQVEETYASMKFCSSDVTDESRRPKLVINYGGKQDTTVNQDTTEVEVYDYSDCLVLQPGQADGKDARVWDLEPTNNYGDDDDVIAAAWTWSGTAGTYRSLLQFDISSIPEGSLVDSAFLFLYYNAVSTTDGQAGENAAYLRRITEPWNENVVTWNTQPSTTSTNEVVLANSISEDQDYLHIDVTDLVQDMVNEPDYSFGFMFRLVTESIYRSMKFNSSEALGDDSLKPMLIVCYHSIKDWVNDNQTQTFQIVPNPVQDFFEVKFPQRTNLKSFVLLNSSGEICLRLNWVNGSDRQRFERPKNLVSGSYLLMGIDENGQLFSRHLFIF